MFVVSRCYGGSSRPVGDPGLPIRRNEKRRHEPDDQPVIVPEDAISHDGCPQGRALDRPVSASPRAQPRPSADRPGNRALPGSGCGGRRLRAGRRVRQLPDVPRGAHARLPHVGGWARGPDLQGRSGRHLCLDHAVPALGRHLPGPERGRSSNRAGGAAGEHLPAPDGRERRLPQLRHGRLHPADVRPVHADRRGRVRALEAASRATPSRRGRSEGRRRGDASEARGRRGQRARGGEPRSGPVGRGGPDRAPARGDRGRRSQQLGRGGRR